MLTRKHILMLAFALVVTGTSLAQTYTAGDQITLQVSSFSLVATNNAPINLTLGTTIAGSPVGVVTNSDMYVRVSSIVPGGTHRELSARISNGTVPAGTQITLVSAPCTTTNSGGALGTVITTPIVLDAIDKILVDNIGTCYTGTGYNDGYRLTYSWQPIPTLTDYSMIKSTVSPVAITVVITITEHNSN